MAAKPQPKPQPKRAKAGPSIKQQQALRDSPQNKAPFNDNAKLNDSQWQRLAPGTSLPSRGPSPLQDFLQRYLVGDPTPRVPMGGLKSNGIFGAGGPALPQAEALRRRLK